MILSAVGFLQPQDFVQQCVIPKPEALAEDFLEGKGEE